MHLQHKISIIIIPTYRLNSLVVKINRLKPKQKKIKNKKNRKYYKKSDPLRHHPSQPNPNTNNPNPKHTLNFMLTQLIKLFKGTFPNKESKMENNSSRYNPNPYQK